MDRKQPKAPTRFSKKARASLDAIIEARRDVRRRFLPDEIPPRVLTHILEAAHRAPSVGLSQPWDFLVITSASTRARVASHVEEERARYQASLAHGRERTFADIKVHAINGAPLLLVVTSTRERGGANVLGRYTQPEATEYSTCLAIENLWLTARGEGVGVGWVSFYRPEVIADMLGLPSYVKPLAMLCMGYVDGFDPVPELALFDWASPRPLSWAVHYEQWGNKSVSPLREALDQIQPLDDTAMRLAAAHQATLTKPVGSLGVLEELAVQLAGISGEAVPKVPASATVAVFAADHGVVASGVTPWPSEVTTQMVGNFLAGGAAINAIARQVGAEVVVIDVGVASELEPAKGLMRRKVRPGTGDISSEPACSREEAYRSVEVGVEVARELVASGARTLITGEMGIGNTTPSAALISWMTRRDPRELTGRGTGVDDAMLVHKIAVIERAIERARHDGDLDDPFELLRQLGGLEIGALAGLIIGGAALRVPVIVDGVIAAAALGLAARMETLVLGYVVAGHLSEEPAAHAMLGSLGVRPLLNLDLRLGEGSGAALAFPLLQAAARIASEMATFDAAGVTHKSDFDAE